ncbi:MFS transporter [Streptomyces sp. NPDC091259]|uniref:MFS transporter n=1 Tax=Streptomyces sp. NPDC091259 TaxID=3365976 RepID=UPI00380D9D4F
MDSSALSKISSTFESLTIRNFRLFTIGQVVSAAGTWMMVVAQDWLVLSVTADSATALSTVTALQFTPLLLTLYGGLLADRYDKRRLLLLVNLAAAVLALLAAVLVLTGVVALWHIYLVALALGCVNAVEIPTRMSFVGEMVGPELLPNASALSGAYFNLARIVGPAGAGLLITVFGIGPVMLLNAVTFLGTIIALGMMRPGELHRPPPAPAGGPPRPARTSGIRDGVRHAVGRGDLLPVLVLVAALSVFGFNFHLTLPLIAKTVFHTDAATFGLFASSMAVGSLAAAFATAGRRTRPSERTVIAAALVFGVVETAVGLAPTVAWSMALLALTGFTTLYFAQAANHRIQLGTDPHFRGRIMALYALILQGSTPLGAVLVGALTARLGPRSGLWAGGLASFAAALVTLLWARGRLTPPRPDRQETRQTIPECVPPATGRGRGH